MVRPTLNVQKLWLGPWYAAMPWDGLAVMPSAEPSLPLEWKACKSHSATYQSQCQQKCPIFHPAPRKYDQLPLCEVLPYFFLFKQHLLNFRKKAEKQTFPPGLYHVLVARSHVHFGEQQQAAVFQTHPNAALRLVPLL